MSTDTRIALLIGNIIKPVEHRIIQRNIFILQKTLLTPNSLPHNPDF